MKLGWALMLAATPLVPAAAQTRTAGSEIRAPVAGLLSAMNNRDVAALDLSLARSVEPEIVYYWGETVRGRDAIRQWHREWFAEAGWSIVPGADTHVLVGSSLATLSGTIRYIKRADRQFVILLTHTLIKEGGAWKVARIQQTFIEGPKD